MKQLFEPKKKLGYRLLAWVLITALVTGLILGSIQLYVEALRVSGEMDERAEETLALVKDASTQAVYSLDEELAEQVIDGLFAQSQVQSAHIAHPDGSALASRSRPSRDTRYREFTDLLFNPFREYRIELIREADATQYGVLRVRVDTAHAAGLWLERAGLILLAGVSQAIIFGLILYLVYHLFVARPLQDIVHSLSDVDPADPGRQLLKTPPGHAGDELDAWVTATNELLRSISDSQQRQQAQEDHITQLSRYDRLTGLPNREMFLSILTTALNNAQRLRTSVAVFCCGLDDFKSINDRFSYASGDRLLRTMAERIQNLDIHPGLTAGRLGADQFVVIQSNLSGHYEASRTAERLLEIIHRPVQVNEEEFAVTATIGVAISPDDARQGDRLLQKAEQSMTLAKTEGPNHFQFYVASVDQAIRDRKQLERDLDLALPESQFHLVYQPQIDMHLHRIVGAEALLRWNHPQRGFVPPDEFIPLAEHNHSIIEIGYWVLDEACRQARHWLDAGIRLRMSVNLSPVQLRQNNIVTVVMGLLRKHALPAELLELEVTETSFMHNLDDAIEKLTSLRDEGVRIAVDDFGTGYSSMSYLKRLPVHHLKIDKQFVRDLLSNEEDTQIANTIIDLGRSLNLEVIAEGVEQEEQGVYLNQRGCQLAQGYYFSRPVKAPEFEAYYRDFTGSA